MISRYLSDLRGTLRSAFGIQDANLTRDTNGLALDNDLWFGDGKGTVGDFYNIGTAAASQHVSFGTNGSRQHMALGAGGGPYTFSASFPPGGGICLLTIQNDSGAEQTPTWGSMFEFGQAGPPVIPDGSECCVLFACNGADLLHGVHSNSPSGGGQVDTIVAGDGIDVDSTDPVNPVVEAKISADVGNDVSIGTDGGLYVPTASGIALQVGGTGEDGDADLDGVNNYTWATRTGNNYVLSGSGNNRTPFINRLRISTGCTLNPSGRAIFARQWDVTSGYHGKVISNGGNGSSATTHIGASGGTQVTVGGSYYPQNAGIGAGGGGHGVASGNSANGGNLTTNRSFQGGEGVRGGQGGAGSTGTPGTGGNPSTFSYLYGAGISPYAPIGDYGVSNNNGEGGGSGTGGTGGTGDGTNAGGGGGGGGAAGGGGDLSIGEIVTDGTTPAYMIKATGGNGGDGATRSVGNVGGGGGGGPGGGGGIRLVLGRLVGPSVAAFLYASGGNGGNGGNGVGTGANGNGAAGAKGGSIRYFNLASGLVSVNIRPAGTPASGAVGGTGGVCTVDLA